MYLKAYKVGCNDVVAAATREQAIGVMVKEGLIDHAEELIIEQVTDLTDSLDVMVIDGDGNDFKTLRNILSEVFRPKLLYSCE